MVQMWAGYVHILGDAYPILLNPCLGLSTEYPWCAPAGKFAVLPCISVQRLDLVLALKLLSLLSGCIKPRPVCREPRSSCVLCETTWNASIPNSQHFKTYTYSMVCRALAIATAASLMTFNLEWIFHKVFTHRLSKPCDCCPGGALGPVNGEPGALKDAETGSSRDLSIQGKTELKRLQNAVRSYTFETG